MPTPQVGLGASGKITRAQLCALQTDVLRAPAAALPGDILHVAYCPPVGGTLGRGPRDGREPGKPFLDTSCVRSKAPFVLTVITLMA